MKPGQYAFLQGQISFDNLPWIRTWWRRVPVANPRTSRMWLSKRDSSTAIKSVYTVDGRALGTVWCKVKCFIVVSFSGYPTTNDHRNYVKYFAVPAAAGPLIAYLLMHTIPFTSHNQQLYISAQSRHLLFSDFREILKSNSLVRKQGEVIVEQSWHWLF